MLYEQGELLIQFVDRSAAELWNEPLVKASNDALPDERVRRTTPHPRRTAAAPDDEERVGPTVPRLRRFLVDQVGIDELLRRVRTQELDRDRGGDRVLLYVRRPRRGFGRVSIVPPDPFDEGAPDDGEDRVFLRRRCRATGRERLVCVPPWIRTCHAAAAWIAGFDDPRAFHLDVET